VRQVHKVSVKKKMNWKPIIISAVATCVIACGVIAEIQYQKAGESYQLNVSDKKLSTSINATKQGYFKYLLSQKGASAAVDEGYYALAENIINKKDYDKYVKQQLESAKKQYKTYDKLFKSVNVSSKKEYIRKYIHDNAYTFLMKKKFINDNQKLLRTKYNLIYVKTASFKDKKKAEQFIKKGDYSSMQEHRALMTNLKTEGINDNLKYKIFRVTDYKKDGFVKKPLYYKNKYWVLYVYNSKRPKRLVLQDILIQDTDKKFDKIAKKFYLKKYHFTTSDRKLYKDIKKKKLI